MVNPHHPERVSRSVGVGSQILMGILPALPGFIAVAIAVVADPVAGQAD